MNKRTVEEAIYKIASLVSDVVPNRGGYKGRAAEIHLDVSDALRTLMDACQEQARRAAQDEMRSCFREILRRCE